MHVNDLGRSTLGSSAQVSSLSLRSLRRVWTKSSLTPPRAFRTLAARATPSSRLPLGVPRGSCKRITHRRRSAGSRRRRSARTVGRSAARVRSGRGPKSELDLRHVRVGQGALQPRVRVVVRALRLPGQDDVQGVNAKDALHAPCAIPLRPKEPLHGVEVAGAGRINLDLCSLHMRQAI